MHELELAVGDAIRIGERLITLIDLDGGEASFRIDELGCETEVADGNARMAPPAK